jgi:hypothetical protein
MKHRIEHRKSIFRSGTNVLVHLDFTDTERRIIRDNNMEAVTIIEQEPTYQLVENANGKKEKLEIDNNIYFKDLYRRRTSWHCDSVLEANDLHKRLFLGLQQFETYLEANMSPVEDTEGDLRIKIPDFSVNLIPDYMWPQHMYIVAESGGGKTQLLQTIFVQQMQSPKPPGIIVLDSQGQMIPIIKARFPNALVIDPVKSPVSLDLFNPGLFNNEIFTVIDTFKYLFESGGQPLTGRQQTAFTYAIALLLIGFPRALNRTASIEDFEEYLIGRKKGMELPPNAHAAADTMGDDMRNWYYNQYAGFQSSHGEILQRLNNICGPLTPLRPLFKKQHDTINLYDAIENGRTILVNTNYDALGRYASSFFGRFFLKLLDKNISHRSVRSPRMILMVDEVQEYFDGQVMKPFPDQARKRNLACVFAGQRLSQLNHDQALKDALLGVGTLIATNVNDADEKEVSNRFRVELDQVRAWRPEYAEGRKPRYADFGYFVKGKHLADTFRLKYGQLEDLPKKNPNRVEEEREKADNGQRGDRPSSDAPINDTKYDDRYDLLWEKLITPAKAKAGFVMTITLPSKRDHLEPIPPNTKNGYRFCVKGASQILRPDGAYGNLWVQLEVPQMKEKEEW